MYLVRLCTVSLVDLLSLKSGLLLKVLAHSGDFKSQPEDGGIILVFFLLLKKPQFREKNRQSVRDL